MVVGGRAVVVGLAIVALALAGPAVAWASGFDQVQTLQPPDGATGDWFGQSVAVSGNTMVVGAPSDKDGTAYEYGAVFVYSQTSPGAWTLEQTLEPTVGDDHSDEFGSAVAVDPGGAIVVGAVNENTKPSGTSVETGAAWVFQPNASGGYTQQELAGSTEDLSEFGTSVAIQGTTIVVGAEQDSSNGSINDEYGAAYVYTQPAAGESFTQAAKLTASGEQNEDEFGGAVAVSGQTILVGAPNFEVNGVAEAGLVFSYNEPSASDNWATGDLTETQLGGPSGAGLFGWALAVTTTPAGSGGTFESGTSTLVVGAPGTQEGSTVDVGAAFVYGLPSNGDITGLSQGAELQPTVSPNTTPEYGNAVAIDGGTIGVAPSTLGNQTYAYSEPAAGWSNSATATAVKPASPSGPLGDGGVAVAGNVFALGAPDNETANGQASTTSGFVYVFDQPAANVAVNLSPGSIPADGTSQSTATATVTDAAGDLASDENVTFSASDQGVGISSVTNNGNGTYTATVTSDTTPGSVTITATDNTPTPAVSGHGTLVQTGAQKVGTSTQVVSSLNPSVGGQPVTFTATVTPAPGGQGSPTGTVSFFANGSQIVTVPLSIGGGVGSASYTISSLPVGTTQITASYGGNAGYSASASPIVSQTVVQVGTSTQVVSSLNPSVGGQPVTFTATVTPAPGGQGSPTGTVSFFANGSQIVTVPLSIGGGVGSASYTISSLPVGTTQITASYGGNAGYSASASPILSQTVVQVNAPTAVKLGRASTKGITVTIPVTCAEPAGTTCRFMVTLTITEHLHHGRLTAVTAVMNHGSQIKTKIVSLGTADVDLTGGEHKNVHITLNGVGRRLLSARRSLNARIAISEFGRTIASSTVSFRVHPKAVRRR